MSLKDTNTRDLLVELAKRREVGVVVEDAFNRGVIWWGFPSSADDMAALVAAARHTSVGESSEPPG